MSQNCRDLPHTATVLRLADAEVLTTDGPFTEGKKRIGGFTIIQAADLDAALASRAVVGRAGSCYLKPQLCATAGALTPAMAHSWGSKAPADPSGVPSLG